MVMHLGPHEVEKIMAVVKHGAANPFSMDDLLDRINNPGLSPGTEPGFQCWIPDGFKIVYTEENQLKGRVRHLSMSCDKKGTLPVPQAVSAIMQIIGFTSPVEQCMVFIEDLEPRHKAVNVLEIIKP